MTRYINILPFLLILLFCSCNKEENTFTPTQNSTQINATLTGIVLDVDENPVFDANISYNGISVTTNFSGIYEFKNVSVDSKHNTVTIKKEGYFESARTFRTSSAKQIIHQTTMLKKDHDHSFQSAQGGIVETDKVTINFAPNSIAYDSNKDTYDGEVLVAITYLDPMDIDLEKKMPGDLTVLTREDIVHKSSTFGMVYVELQSASGEPLQIKEGSTAKLQIEVPDEFLSDAPQSLEASHFDEELGVWRHEAKATLTGNTYVSDVTHFSCWNYNSSDPSVIITGRVVDENGQPAAGLWIQISNYGGWSGGFGSTDENGEFTGAIAKGKNLKIYIPSPSFFCEGILFLLNDEIGPFSSDVNVGDIAVDLSDLESLTIEATFINCDNDPVTNGVAYAARRLFKITNGTLNVTVSGCDDGTAYTFWVHDLDTDRVSERLPLVIGQVNSYEDYSICQIEARFIEVIAPDLGINERTTTEIIASDTDEVKNLHGLYKANIAEGWSQIELEYTDTNPNGFEKGSWNITRGTIQFWPFTSVLNYTAGVGDGEVVIEEVGTDGLGNYIKGHYKIDFEDINTGIVYEFVGKFNLGIY